MLIHVLARVNPLRGIHSEIDILQGRVNNIQDQVNNFVEEIQKKPMAAQAIQALTTVTQPSGCPSEVMFFAMNFEM